MAKSKNMKNSGTRTVGAPNSDYDPVFAAWAKLMGYRPLDEIIELLKLLPEDERFEVSKKLSDPDDKIYHEDFDEAYGKYFRPAG